MIFVNSEWGKLLADADVAGIYRTQSNGKVKMSTVPAPHQGLGVAQYMWASSPLRRYVDLVNQRQIIAWMRGERPPYAPRSEPRCSPRCAISSRPTSIYNDFQRTMERYWCLRWLLQESISTDRRRGDARQPGQARRHPAGGQGARAALARPGHPRRRSRSPTSTSSRSISACSTGAPVQAARNDSGPALAYNAATPTLS